MRLHYAIEIESQGQVIRRYWSFAHRTRDMVSGEVEGINRTDPRVLVANQLDQWQEGVHFVYDSVRIDKGDPR